MGSGGVAFEQATIAAQEMSDASIVEWPLTFTPSVIQAAFLKAASQNEDYGLHWVTQYQYASVRGTTFTT
jgi:hypothetical protein